jgi:alginate O-acetyltransferase complex protein AlgI
MGFTTIIFLLYFLPLVLIVYYAVPGKFKISLLLAVSYLFYLWGSPTGAVVLLLATVIDYLFGKAIHGAEQQKKKKLLLGISVTLNILVLVYFKYTNFFIGEANRLLGSLDLSTISWTVVIFPVGISFITFHRISYLVDIYYGKVEPAHNIMTYALYLAMFPKLTQGPVVRYQDIAEQIAKPRYTFDDIFEGSIRICTGLSKKVLLADPMGSVVNSIFSMDIASLTVGYAWLGVICHSFQIYLDFAGYSDIAIGIGRMMGFTFPENFNRPYIVENFTEHWKRWHMSMVRWFLEYLYIPLGGNREGKLKTYRNLWIVFILSGFWHGANWTYLTWGIYNGLFIFLERLFLIRIMKRVPTVLKVAQFYILLIIGHALFRSETITGAFRYIHRMFDVTAIGAVKSPVLLANLLGNREMFVLAACFLICFFPEKPYERIRLMMTTRIGTQGITRLRIAAACILFLLSLISLINNSFSPFIYFRF